MRNKRAISLIVLVITILVLSILAATVIITLSNANIINEANDAVKKTEVQQIEEMKTLMLSDGLIGKEPEARTIGNYTLTWDDTNKKVLVTFDTVVIPDGFHYVEGEKDTGLVIEDKDGNQFVWVPVEYTATGTKDEYGLYEGFKAVFKRGTAEETTTGSGIYKMTGNEIEDEEVEFVNSLPESGYSMGSCYLEPESTSESDVEEYYAMCNSVQKYNGFYIARFEAAVSTGERRNESDEAVPIIVRRGGIAYNYLPYDVDAKTLSRNMYKEHRSVVSTLCYSVQWDAIMNFISDADHNIYDSTSWGNYLDSTEFDMDTVDITCGRNEVDKAKNIYDLASNLYELTMEFRYDYFEGAPTDIFRISRGGNVGYGGSACDRSVTDGLWETGFRPALYLK